MRSVRLKNSIILLTMFLMFPLPALAIPAITCHCFKDRSYEPARPAAADPYFLATVQNTFFAVVFNVDKKAIVMKKQQGTSPDDLWIAYWIASKTGTSAEKLLQIKHTSAAWKDVVGSQQIPTRDLGAVFTRQLNSASSSTLLAETVVNDIFLHYQLLGDLELTAVRHAGASNQELIISTVIATKARQPVRQVYLDVKKGAKTWGAFLAAAKIDTKNLQQELSNVLKLQPQ